MLFRNLSLILLFTITACERLPPKRCDSECMKCLTDCVTQCKESYNNCFRTATPANKSTYENCPYHAQQCMLSCPEKCKSSK
jgi:hypothetical protein